MMSRAEWEYSVAHINAQSAGLFFLFCLVVIGICMWRDMSKERKEDETRNKTRKP